MKLARFSAVALAIAGAAGCRTTEDVLRDYEASIVAGDYAAPAAETCKLTEEGGRSQLLWHLMSGASLYMADDSAGSIAQFDSAEDVFARNDATSVFAQGGEGAFAMITNDRAFTYDGGGIDRVFTCLYKAIDFMSLGDSGKARVELNRASQYQSNWLAARRKDIVAAAKRMESEAAAYERSNNATVRNDRGRIAANAIANGSLAAQIRRNCNFDVATSGNLDTLGASDYMNTYASHVTGVFRWINGDSDRGHLREAAAYASGCATAQRDNAEFRQGANPGNQVWIWVEDGLCQCREEWQFELPLILLPFVGNYLPYVGMALPVLRERAPGASDWTVSSGSGASVRMDELVDVDRLIKTEYDVYMRGAITREVTRTVVKAGVQVALGVAADAAARRHGSRSGQYLSLKISQLAVAAWAKASLGADVRSWTALPKSVKVARVERPADGRIDVWADGQKIELTVGEGNTLVFIRKPGAQAIPMVRQVNFK